MNQEQTKGAVLLGISALVGSIFGAHELYDPDLGWNLAGGLISIRDLNVPRIDELGVGREQWVDYCWLPQLLFAAIYKVAGFSGLLCLQIFFSALCVTFLALGIVFAEKDIQARSVLKVGAGMLFIAPICHLRPQLVSVILFVAFLIWRQSKRRMLYLIALQLIWVNTHVYWVFAPAILFVDALLARHSFRPVFVSALIAVCSPYGVLNIVAIFEYAFNHSHAQNLIREFQPVYSTVGYLFPLTILTLIFSLATHRSLRDRVISAGLFLLALMQMKFTPLFGSAALIPSAGQTRRVYRLALASAVGSSIVVSVVALTVFSSPLRGEEEQILSASKIIAGEGNENSVVGNSFNEGGWLGLGLLNSGARTLIDGRTLVMKKARLDHYAAVMRGDVPVCEYLNDASHAVFRRRGKILKRLEAEPCFARWSKVYETEIFITLRKG